MTQVPATDAVFRVPKPHSKAPLRCCSQLFAAHVSPKASGNPGAVPWDEGGWDAYGRDWRHYFDCMLAPVARQAVGVLERLDSLTVPATGATSVFLSAFNRMQVRLPPDDGPQRTVVAEESCNQSTNYMSG